METMTELIHRCLACNELAYEVEVEFSKECLRKVYALYECSKCRFTWEVVSCGRQGSL